MLSAVLLPLGEAAAGKSGRTNGLVSFGTCCGDGTTGIYTIRPDGTAQRHIYKQKFDDASLISAWSPSGNAHRVRRARRAVDDVAAGTQGKRLAKGKGDTLAPNWSADGKQIVFVDLAAKHGRTTRST